MLLSCDQCSNHDAPEQYHQTYGPGCTDTEWILENWKFEQSGAPDCWFTTGDTTKLVSNGHRAFGVTIKNPENIIL
jgi:hypothetical protein